jgi:hypothetical protein
MSVVGHGSTGTVADSFFLLLAAGADRGGFLPAERAQGNLLVALGGVDYEGARLDLTDKMEQEHTWRGLERAVLSPTSTLG